MKRVLFCIAIVVTWLALTYQVQAQKMSGANLDCKQCHTCEMPTKFNPCLKNCPVGAMIPVHFSSDASPVALSLNDVPGGQHVYGPVQFPHRSHASMAEMSKGCVQCHHYNLSGNVLSCKSCHTVEPPAKNKDLTKPGLKGAYHRQCIICHRESGLDTRCDGSCHQAKSRSGTANNAPVSPVKQSTIVKPDRMIFQSANSDAPVVTFFHSDHSDRFGISCSSCHKEVKCSFCHQAQGTAQKQAAYVKGTHDRCSRCHSVDDNCSMCHSTKPLPAFDHASRSGFDLGKFHSKLLCSNCHKKSDTRKGLSPRCTSCHTGWKPGAFAHQVTGIQLDETHATFDCDNCHTGSNFAAKPSCKSCHDDKSYPTVVPGKRVQPGKAAGTAVAK